MYIYTVLNFHAHVYTHVIDVLTCTYFNLLAQKFCEDANRGSLTLHSLAAYDYKYKNHFMK